MAIKKISRPTSSLFMIIFLFGFFVLVNALSSQTISSVYFRLVNEDRGGVVLFLKKIITLPQFASEYKNYYSVYGKTIENEVFSEKRAREQKINELERILVNNPGERDVLYSLFLLYQAEGDEKKAEEYLKRAKTVDPLIINN